eukprot:5716413-Amphidinium_carterae.1
MNSEKILFSNAVSVGPKMVPFHSERVMSSSLHAQVASCVVEAKRFDTTKTLELTLLLDMWEGFACLERGRG